MNADTQKIDQSVQDGGNVDNQHPWIGLESFTEATRSYFYGREDEVSELSRRVQRKLLTVLFGQSGLGKTSILRAGIVPRLRPEGYCPVYVRVDYSPEAPSPSEQIKKAIHESSSAIGQWTQPDAASAGESLWEFLHHRDDVLLDSAGKTVVPLLIFDQFEEIFTLAQADDAGRKRAATFIEDLADLVENRPPKALEARLEDDDTITDRFDFNREDYRILIALREDYLAQLESVKGVMPSITQNRMRLARMTGQQALAAVMKPGGNLVTQEIAEAIVRFVAGGSELPNAEVEPSLLSLICRELNNARIAQGKSEISADLLAGSHDTILSEFYERALADQPLAVRKVIEDELLTDSGYRENLAVERLQKAFAAVGVSPEAIPKLVNRRLLRVEERLDVRRVELTHDVLCSVVKASRAHRKEREARDEVEKNLAVQQEHQRTTRKALIRARQIAVGCAALSLVAVGSGIYAVYSAKQATSAEAEAVKTRASSETSRAESEKLLVYILDDFYEEMSPIGRLDVVGGLAQKAVDYYARLPAEARTPETLRNSALAQARYAQVLSQLSRPDEATALLATAAKTVNDMRAAGDNSDDTLIALARVSAVRTETLSIRDDLLGAIQLAEDALAALAPVLTKPDPSRIARRTEAEVRDRIASAQRSSGNFAAAIDNQRLSRKIAVDLGALDLTDLVATAGYVSGGWLLGDLLIRTGKADEGDPILQETIKLSDQLLEKRPGHRVALRTKSLAYNGLFQSDDQRLRFERALRYARESQRFSEQLLALDPGNSRSQNILRISRQAASFYLFHLGRIDEAMSVAQSMINVAPAERFDAHHMRNLIYMQGSVAGLAAQMGRFEAAETELKREDDYVKTLLSASNVESARSDAIGMAAFWRASVDIERGKPDQVEPTLSQHINARLASLALSDAKDSTGRDEFLPEWNDTVARAMLMKGDYAGAANYARKALDFILKDKSNSLLPQLQINNMRARLAMALARHGKPSEAINELKPVLAFHALPAVRGSDVQTVKGDYAHALLAAALANPAEKQTRLAEALRNFDAMPAQMKALTNYVRLREEIVREQGKNENAQRQKSSR